jgi:diacylglycerol kinase (ATP)
VQSLLKSFSYAVAGVVDLIKSQRSARIHLTWTLATAGLVWWLRLDAEQIAIVALAVAAVWSAEAANTAVEFLADRVTREKDPLIGRAKDVAAASVLLAALGAIAVGLVILGPPILRKVGLA